MKIFLAMVALVSVWYFGLKLWIWILSHVETTIPGSYYVRSEHKND